MQIVFLVFDKLTVLDAIGPYEVLARLPGARVQFVAPAAGIVRSDNGIVALSVETSIDQVQDCDVLVVPGGFGTRVLERDSRVLDFICKLDAGTRITASVCTGALVLGAAGLLRGRRANTHWAQRQRLAEYGAIGVDQRVVRDGKYASAAGVSAGIDLALELAIELAGREAAEAIQLSIEYDPAPPLSAGSPQTAPPQVRDRVLAAIRKRDAELTAQG
jgi:putative intracellular protease/amidase